jgi:glutamate racemase
MTSSNKSAWYNDEGKNMTIGILDSGLGGYSVYHALRGAYPNASFLFLADQLTAPFGDKTKDQIFEIACDAMSWFEKQGIEEILVACNTISALVIDEVKGLYPHLKITGIIDLTVNQFKDNPVEEILVLATAGTINSLAYPYKFEKLLSKKHISSKALPLLVPQLEGLAPLEEIKAYLEESLLPYKNKTQGVVLACTHYPLVKKLIEDLLKTRSYDSIEPILKHFSNRDLPQGSSQVLTTKDPMYMAKQIHTLFNKEEIVYLTQVEHANRRG